MWGGLGHHLHSAEHQMNSFKGEFWFLCHWLGQCQPNLAHPSSGGGARNQLKTGVCLTRHTRYGSDARQTHTSDTPEAAPRGFLKDPPRGPRGASTQADKKKPAGSWTQLVPQR